MKKIIVLLMMVLMIALPAMAEIPAGEPVLLEGVVLETLENGYLIYSEEMGRVEVHVGEDTLIEANGEIVCGDYVYIDYNGAATRSLPPQIHAQTIRMHKLEGEILEFNAEENTVLMNDAVMGEVLVNLPQTWQGKEICEAYMTVYFNGATTMSLPPQVSAGLVLPGYSVAGAVSEMTDEYLLLGEQASAIQVNLNGMEAPEGMKEGSFVRVFFNGQMTRSIPAQLNALSIEWLEPTDPSVQNDQSEI